MMSDPSIREGYVQGAMARSMEKAAANPNGAMNGFMGVQMGMNAFWFLVCIGVRFESAADAAAGGSQGTAGSCKRRMEMLLRNGEHRQFLLKLRKC